MCQFRSVFLQNLPLLFTIHWDESTEFNEDAELEEMVASLVTACQHDTNQIHGDTAPSQHVGEAELKTRNFDDATSVGVHSDASQGQNHWEEKDSS